MTGPARDVTSIAGASDAPQSLVFELPASPAAVSAARRAVLAANGGVPSTVRADVLLLLTELVSNAVRHAKAGAGRTVHVELQQGARMIGVAVFDEGTGFTAEAPHPERDGSGGWGLFLIDRIADRWGITPTGSGTCAWFEIECHQ
jgi:anti-sigma regulatory factor (Ser/Thr protein kinase)